jgi:hypothetical protein
MIKPKTKARRVYEIARRMQQVGQQGLAAHLGQPPRRKWSSLAPEQQAGWRALAEWHITQLMTEDQTTRAEHLKWCKQRALEYCDMGDVAQAFASMSSDLGKHPETENHAAIQLGTMLLIAGHLNSPAEMRKFIEGFN